MNAAFATALERLNSAVVGRLSADVVSVDGLTVNALFDNGNSLGQVGMLGMTSTQPMLTLRTADLPTYPVGSAVVVNGAAYQAAVHEPDGLGMSRLLLESTT